ncbi:hypothetical protein GWI33_008612 [Rhynchophorus ferrugineus]|uniref:Uncharacterized protein n=1 Tax=Rhynchophorus ferrugineus TaxID=354439 RepID=A0A834IFY0_RHYFE|nr:hypothetical protein GWI33_008612 [Rhynchophorus ferrugineus]
MATFDDDTAVIAVGDNSEEASRTLQQNKVLRSIIDALKYYITDYLHRDLQIPTVSQEIKRIVRGHEEKLQSHENIDVLHLWIPPEQGTDSKESNHLILYSVVL